MHLDENNDKLDTGDENINEFEDTAIKTFQEETEKKHTSIHK